MTVLLLDNYDSFTYNLAQYLGELGHAPIVRGHSSTISVDWIRVGVVAFILAVTVSVNVFANLNYPAALEQFPVIGAAVWGAILLTAPLRRPAWAVLREGTKGSAFLLALVLCASLMPVETLPPASWLSALIRPPISPSTTG